MPRIHLVNPSVKSFGVAVITPRWLYVLAAATGSRWGDPVIVDETLHAAHHPHCRSTLSCPCHWLHMGGIGAAP